MAQVQKFELTYSTKSQLKRLNNPLKYNINKIFAFIFIKYGKIRIFFCLTLRYFSKLTATEANKT